MLILCDQTHSIDSFITDSANSASALYSGHKSTVNAMGCVARRHMFMKAFLIVDPTVSTPTLLPTSMMTPRSRLLLSSSRASGYV